MRLQALPPMANPRLTEVTNRSNHPQSRGKNSRMSHNAVPGLQHALHLAAMRTYRKTLQTLTKIAKRPRLLLPSKWRKLISIQTISQKQEICLTNELSNYFWHFSHSIGALHGKSANETSRFRISFCRSFCFSAFLRCPVFFFGMFLLV